jgi:hypothetical protein
MSDRATDGSSDRGARLVEMLGAIADAANGASSAEEAFRVALEEVCGATGWPVGHVYAVTGGPAPGLTDIGTWHPGRDDRFADLRRSLEGARVSPEEGAAGCALDAGAPARFPEHGRTGTALLDAARAALQAARAQGGGHLEMAKIRTTRPEESRS